MNGGCSTIDCFDPKPALEKYDGQPMPGGAVKTERRTGELMKSPYKFKKYGECGMDISELWPHLSEFADDICWVRSVYTDIPNHEPACLMLNSGANQAGRPSVGAWLTYGLGTDNQSLPGFVVLSPKVPTTVGSPLWSNGFLPAVNQGTFISSAMQTKPKPDAMDDDTDMDMPVENAENWTCWKKWKPSSASVLVQMPTWRLSSNRWKLPIECRPRRRKSSTCEKNRKRRWICTAKALQRGVAFRRRAWRKKVFELCRCTTPAGIHGMPTTTSWRTRSTRRIRIRPMGHYSKTSSREVYGKTHSSFVGPSLAVLRYAKSAEQETESNAAATTIRSDSRCGWPAEPSREAPSMALRTSLVSRRSRSRHMFTTFTRRFSI